MTSTAASRASGQVPERPFYVTGGTLPSDASSYVERQADQELYDSLLGSEYCYVLNTRQMGKSSLMIRTAARLRAQGVVGRTVALKIRFADFTTITRSRTLPEATDVARVVYDTALSLYEALGLERARLRLVGVRVEQLRPASEQPHQLLLGERDQGWREAEQAVDRATRRFGAGAVRPAALVRTRDEEVPPSR
jgi:DNA polymerase-4